MFRAHLPLTVLSLLMFAGTVAGEDRLARLESLTGQWQKLHGDFEQAKKEHGKLLDRYKELDRKYDDIAKDINQQEATIARLKKQKEPERDKKGKKNPNADRKNDQIEREIKEHQRKIGELKNKLPPLRKEADQVSDQGKKLEAEGAKKKQTLWKWRHDWVEAADLMLQDSPETAKAFLAQLKKRDARGPLGEAWQLARSAALAASEDYDSALTELEPLLKNDVWEAKAASLQGLIRLKRGNLDECESSWKRALRSDNDDPHAFLVRGLHAVKEKEMYDAERYFELAISHDRDHEKSYRAIARGAGIEVTEGKGKK